VDVVRHLTAAKQASTRGQAQHVSTAGTQPSSGQCQHVLHQGTSSVGAVGPLVPLGADSVLAGCRPLH
jgi:hypothetical protein